MKKHLKTLLAFLLVAALLSGSVTAFAEEGGDPNTAGVTEDSGEGTPGQDEGQSTSPSEDTPAPQNSEGVPEGTTGDGSADPQGGDPAQNSNSGEPQETQPDPNGQAPGNGPERQGPYMGRASFYPSGGTAYAGQTVVVELYFYCENGIQSVSGQVTTTGLQYVSSDIPESFDLTPGGAQNVSFSFTYTVTAEVGESVVLGLSGLKATAPDGTEIQLDSYGGEIPVQDPDTALTPDKSALEAAVKKAEALKEEDYTSSSWRWFTYNLNDAKAALAVYDIHPTRVNEALSNLEHSMSNLQPYDADAAAAAKADLEEALKKLAAADLSKLSEQQQRFAESLKADAEQELAFERPNANNMTYDAEDINALLEGLFEDVDVKALKAQLDEIKAKGLKEEDYTNTSWGDLERAMEDAESVVEDPILYNIEFFKNNLINAYKGLVKFVPLDPATEAELEAALKKANAAKKGDYDDNTLWQIQDAVSKANGAFYRERYDKAEVEAWLKVLTSLLDGKNPTNYSALATIVAKAEKLDPSAYSWESWSDLYYAVLDAQEILRDKDVGAFLQADVDQATAEVTAAYNALVKGNSGSTTDPGKDSVPKTGDPMVPVLEGGAVMALLLGAALVGKKSLARR